MVAVFEKTARIPSSLMEMRSVHAFLNFSVRQRRFVPDCITDCTACENLLSLPALCSCSASAIRRESCEILKDSSMPRGHLGVIRHALQQQAGHCWFPNCDENRMYFFFLAASFAKRNTTTSFCRHCSNHAR